MAGAHPWQPSWASAAELTFAATGALLLIGISLWRRGLWLVVPGALLVATVVAVAFQLFVQQRLLLNPLSPVLTITAVYIALAMSSYLLAERERRWIQRAFSSYLSPNLVRHLMRDPRQLNLGGERRHCSFIMTDLAGFTPLVECCEPEMLVDLLNRYLDRLVEVVSSGLSRLRRPDQHRSALGDGKQGVRHTADLQRGDARALRKPTGDPTHRRAAAQG